MDKQLDIEDVPTQDSVQDEPEGTGGRVSLSANDNIVAISAQNNDANGMSSSYVRVFRNNSGVWTQIGQSVNGEAASDQFGGSISLSADGSKLAVGTATLNNSNKGYTKVYDLVTVLSSDSFIKASFNVYPNPASEILNITLENELFLEKVIIYNNLGQIVKTTKGKTINISSFAKSLYHVEVISNKGKASKKVILK
ncbi:T9SS type A sorting domain-containing protein [Flavobacterium sp. xlx-214]|uniref:T9SS type A sorting domain-containing protein n=1 Tax=unclassified Flavobacterium TaxID=196869 RepID=UPI0013D6DEEB|nr:MULTISPECIES: T9SS type A sorting domain-containing protein [unclassified Flavobacterium]MBA5793508.1 T9SS type A sorting domain-containing protein [Flavobacterium sp. xlx-221]QMI82722.1 T9SS type A sorting domain-containing protein [Flavobacterium sp. xlx-214]